MKRDFDAKEIKKMKTQPQPPNLRRLSRTRTPACLVSRGFYSPPPQMSKMDLMRSSPLTNEAVICQKGKSAVNLVRAHPLTPRQPALRLAGRRGRTAIYSGRGK